MPIQVSDCFPSTVSHLAQWYFSVYIVLDDVSIRTTRERRPIAHVAYVNFVHRMAISSSSGLALNGALQELLSRTLR